MSFTKLFSGSSWFSRDIFVDVNFFGFSLVFLCLLMSLRMVIVICRGIIFSEFCNEYIFERKGE